MAGTEYAAFTDYEARAVPLLPSRLDRAVIAIVRVGVALLWTLEKSLGAGFTPAVKSAWTATYALFARTMMAGAHSAASAA